MTPQAALDLAYTAVMTAVKMAAPLMLTAIIVGIVMNIIQTVTSIRDMSMIFVPKVLVCGAVLSLTLPWMIQTMTSYFNEMYGMFGAVAY